MRIFFFIGVLLANQLKGAFTATNWTGVYEVNRDFILLLLFFSYYNKQ